MKFDWKIAIACIIGALIVVLIVASLSLGESEEDEIYGPAVGLAIMIYDEEGTTYEERGERVQRLSRIFDHIVIT